MYIFNEIVKMFIDTFAMGYQGLLLVLPMSKSIEVAIFFHRNLKIEPLLVRFCEEAQLNLPNLQAITDTANDSY